MKNFIMKNSLIIFLFAISSIASSTYAENESPLHTAYLHGFGGNGTDGRFWSDLGDTLSAPTFPDAPGRMTKACLYTKAAVHTASTHLREQVIEQGKKSIVLVGFSCGAGTMFNCLEKLLNYSPSYFEGTNITQEDANQIIAAINNGAIISTAALLALRKGNIVIVPAAILSALTVLCGTIATYYYYASRYAENTDKNPQTKEGLEPSTDKMEQENRSITGMSIPEKLKSWLKIEKKHLIKSAIILGGGIVYWALDNIIKQVYIYSMVNWMAPRITNYNFDPNHTDPLQAIQLFDGKLTCPILIHQHEKDGIVKDPDQDTIDMYEALAKHGKTHILITTDSWHNAGSEQLLQTVKSFINKYFGGNLQVDMSETQPSLDELKQQIFGKKKK